MCAICGCGTGMGIRVGGHEHHHGDEHFGPGGEDVHSGGHGEGIANHSHGHGARSSNHSHGHGERIANHSHEADAESTLRLGTSSRMANLEIDLLEKNNHLAGHNRDWLSQRGIFALNLMGSPGAGKTALLEQTSIRLGRELGVTVLEGDQETDADAQRIRAAGSRAVQINTGAGCHLDAEMVAVGLHRLEPMERSVVFMENVGNLVCPALFDLGESARVVVLSVTEGEDKPLKYPHVFRAADVLVLNKIDLLPHLSFERERCLENALQINPALRIFEISATRGDGVDRWCDWLRQELRGFQPGS